jgi:prepilin-type N-terminal cleavage/methylation domain-containing protein
MRAKRPNSGFTLIEILIAMAIFGVVIAQAFAVFMSQHAVYMGTERSIEVQEDARLVADAVLTEIRMAGYMVPRVAGIASVDGGNSDADLLCTSDSNVIADSAVATAVARFDRAEVAVPVGNGATSAQLSAGHLDVDGDSVNDFAVGQGIILADGTSSHCAEIQTIGGTGGTTIGFLPQTPALFSLTTATGRVTPAVIWRVSGTDLLRNGIRLSNQVEDLQVEFGVDIDGDGQLGTGELGIDDLNGKDAEAILRVRLSVITRADREDDKLQHSGRPAAANRDAGTPDGFRRRSNINSVVPRNLM